MSDANVAKPTKEQRALEYYTHAAEFTDFFFSATQGDGRSGAVNDVQQASAKLLILGHALELTLKGWLVVKEGAPVNRGTGNTGVNSLKYYGHDLAKLANATVQYCPDLKPYLDRKVVGKNESGEPVFAPSIIEHLNSSYWAGGARAYEYPEGDDELQGDEVLAFISPMSKFAEFVNNCRHELLNAIMSENGGTVPPQYRKPATGASGQDSIGVANT